MSPERSVYILDPKRLSPETIAVTFAKTSRSPESFREIAAQLTDEKSAEFHEKWVVGYGHASVAEHAVLHIAAENISRLAVETLESNRLASYTEKSTRYQKWDLEQFYTPAELIGHPLEQAYTATCQLLFQSYQASLPAVRQVIADENPRREGESETAWERRMRSNYVDVCRYFLPAASLANVGMTINARALEHAIRKMLSHPLEEVRALGAEIKSVSQAHVPTLVKYADAAPYLENVRQSLSAQAVQTAAAFDPEADWCTLIDCSPDGENLVLAAALYRYSQLSYAQAMDAVRKASPEERHRLADLVLGSLGPYDSPIRETENLAYTFDVIVDQGAYFELKRHRMMTQSPQPLTTHLGYSIPRRIVMAGMEIPFRAAMEQARQTFEAISAALSPDVAAYVVPNAYRRRVLLTFNFRTAMHFVQLRAAANAHFSVRRLAQRMADEIRIATPLLGSYLPNPTGETWGGIEADHFSAA